MGFFDDVVDIGGKIGGKIVEGVGSQFKGEKITLEKMAQDYPETFKKVQEEIGVKPDGIIGPGTRSAYKDYIEGGAKVSETGKRITAPDDYIKGAGEGDMLINAHVLENLMDIKPPAAMKGNLKGSALETEIPVLAGVSGGVDVEGNVPAQRGESSGERQIT